MTCYNFAVCSIDAAFEQKSGVLKNDIEIPYNSAEQRQYYNKTDTLMPSILSTQTKITKVIGH